MFPNNISILITHDFPVFGIICWLPSLKDDWLASLWERWGLWSLSDFLVTVHMHLLIHEPPIRGSNLSFALISICVDIIIAILTQLSHIVRYEYFSFPAHLWSSSMYPGIPVQDPFDSKGTFTKELGIFSFNFRIVTQLGESFFGKQKQKTLFKSISYSFLFKSVKLGKPDVFFWKCIQLSISCIYTMTWYPYHDIIMQHPSLGSLRLLTDILGVCTCWVEFRILFLPNYMLRNCFSYKGESISLLGFILIPKIYMLSYSKLKEARICVNFMPPPRLEFTML